MTTTDDTIVPGTRKRLVIAGAGFMAGLLILLSGIYYQQVIRHQFWLARMRTGSDVKVRIPAMRGEIRDRNGVLLAENRPSYAVEFYLPDIVGSYRESNGDVPTYEHYSTVRGMKKIMREADIVKIVNQTAIPHLEELGLAEDYNSERMRLHYRNNREVPFVYRTGIDFSNFAKYSEGKAGLTGVEITNRPVRNYPFGALAAHLLGYTGAVRDIKDQEDVGEFTFYEPDPEGKSQIEHACDKWLRGKPGARILHRNPKGVIEGETKRIEPKPGANVLLTIDARMQFIVERALREAGVGRGAAVVVNPNNGDILAMASVPSYDPNIFIPSASVADWKKLTDDATDPLTNRAVQTYAPGSIYKVVTALAELRANIAPTRTFTCSGGVQYGNKYMKCWIAGRGTHGALTLPDALKNSCNAYFYQAGNAAGINQIDAIGEKLGLGKKTGIPISGESSGILPGPKWLNSVNPNERWSDGQTANVSIGQGYVLASPLQMAMVTAAIANRGTVFEPRLVYRMVDQNGADARDPDSDRLIVKKQPKIHADLRHEGISPEKIEAVRDGMRRVVANGTGKRAQINGIEVAGKTGTAQFWRGNTKDNHTWFIAFAPYDAPQLALCVMVQGAKSGGGVSAPIAREILEQGLALDHGYQPKLIAMTPAVGSFDQINAVDYKRDAPRALPAAAAADTTVAAAAPRAIPVDSSVSTDDNDDPETADAVEEEIPRAIPRAIYVGPPKPEKPDVRAAPDVVVELHPPGT